MANDPLEMLREALEKIKAKGRQEVSVDSLLSYLSEIAPQGTMSQAGQEFQQKVALTQLGIAADQRRVFTEEHTQFNRFAIETGQGAIRAAMFINGGAAVAILAFVGNAWVKALPTALIEHVTDALAWFSFGVLAAAFTGGLSYLIQRAFLQGFGEDASGRWNRVGDRLNVFAILVMFGSYGCFARAVWLVYQGLKPLISTS